MENYNVSKVSSYIMYLDANNLYGWGMLQPLHKSNFQWLTDEEMEESDVMMIPDDSPKIRILECDLDNYYFHQNVPSFYYLYIRIHFIFYIFFLMYPLEKCHVFFLCISEYPHELHDLHKVYPLAPECFQMEENFLSDYQRHLLQHEDSPNSKKLVPNLHKKTN